MCGQPRTVLSARVCFLPVNPSKRGQILETLRKELLTNGHRFPTDLRVAPLTDYPVKILQFGEGNFLRCFIDWMVQKMNDQGLFCGKAVLVVPMHFGRVADLLNSQDGLYTTLLRGFVNGKLMEEKEIIESVDHVIDPHAHFDEYLRCAENPDLRFIVSNTTEEGIAYNPNDRPDDMPPASFPGKLLVLLHARYTYFRGAHDKGLVILPCELIEKNGDALKKIVCRLADEWGYDDGFKAWLEESCYFLNTLVDRIVTGYPREEIETITESLGYVDNVVDAAEPFLFWAIEGGDFSNELPLVQAGLNVKWTNDMTRYRTRKVRILNGAHTMTVPGAFLAGKNTVKEFMDDPETEAYLNKGLFDEVLPTLDLNPEELLSYTHAVSERFANPFIQHHLTAIMLNATSKFKARILPSLLGYVEKKEELPPILSFSLAALIAFYHGSGVAGRKMKGVRMVNGAPEEYEIDDDTEALLFFEKVWKEYEEDHDSFSLARKVLQNTEMWGQDLTEVPGLTDKIGFYLSEIGSKGTKAVMASL